MFSIIFTRDPRRRTNCFHASSDQSRESRANDHDRFVDEIMTHLESSKQLNGPHAVRLEAQRDLRVPARTLRTRYGYDVAVANLSRSGLLLEWRNDKLKILHHLHIKYLKDWRSMTEDNGLEKEKMLTTLLSLINSLSSGLKNTG